MKEWIKIYVVAGSLLCLCLGAVCGLRHFYPALNSNDFTLAAMGAIAILTVWMVILIWAIKE